LNAKFRQEGFFIFPFCFLLGVVGLPCQHGIEAVGVRCKTGTVLYLALEDDYQRLQEHRVAAGVLGKENYKYMNQTKAE